MSYIGNSPISSAFLTDTFSGNASTTAFTMSVAPANTSSVIVAVTGVLQDPSTYSVSGTTLTFSAAPPTGTNNISVRYLGIPASGVTTTAYRTVTDATATAGQTSFSFPSYTVGYINVYRNGVLLSTSDYVATTGTTVVLNNAATAGDTITAESFYVSSVLNALPTTGGSISGQLTVNSATGQKPLIAQVNGTEVFEIDSSGNVGVGTSSPQGKLSVSNSGAAGFEFFTNSPAGGVGTYIQSYNRSGSAFVDTYYYATSHTWRTSASATSMTLDSNGNVGIGASSPTAKLDVYGTGTQYILLRNATTTNQIAVDSSAAYFGSVTNSPVVFTANNGEKMRIDSSGYVGIGSGSPSSFGYLTVENPNNTRAGWFYVNVASSLSTPAISLVKKDNNTTTSQVLATFYVNGSLTQQGQINANGANAAAFGSFSDARLKENIVDLPSQLANIMALRPVEFDYIESEGGGHQIGFVAQEVKEIYPDLVGEREDGMFTLSDLNKNDARLIKAIQEQQALIQQLQADVAALKGQQ